MKHMRIDLQRSHLLLYVGIIALAIAGSATSLANSYALDDVALVSQNSRVHSLNEWWRLFTVPYWPPQVGASLYRPVVTLGFAVQWAASGGAPWLFHLTSIVLYATASALVFALFVLVLPVDAAFIGAALFAVHPVHVEAVGNIVGQAELLAGSTTLAGAVIYVRCRRAGMLNTRNITWLALLFAIACLSKEHALLFPAILCVLELFAVPLAATTTIARHRDRVRAVMPLFAVLAAVAIAYVVVRTIVIGDLLGEKALVPVRGGLRPWVLLAVVPHWVRLFTWPARLTADYSPQHITIPSGFGLELIPGLILVAVGAAVFIALGRGRADTAADRRAGRCALLWTAITLLPVSNLFSVMLVAERTLFMPSVGAMLGVGVLASAVSNRVTGTAHAEMVRLARALAATVLVVAGGVWSSQRQRVWRDDKILFTQTVTDAPMSYRAQFFYGQLMFEEGRRAEGERHLRRAIELNPTESDVSPLNYLATQYRVAGLCRHALPLYERASAADAERPDVRYGLAACLLESGRPVDARRVAEEGMRRGDLRSLFRQLIARTDSVSRHD
jgi:protein O-mannosyl-transferase